MRFGLLVALFVTVVPAAFAANPKCNAILSAKFAALSPAGKEFLAEIVATRSAKDWKIIEPDLFEDMRTRLGIREIAFSQMMKASALSESDRNPLLLRIARLNLNPAHDKILRLGLFEHKAWLRLLRAIAVYEDFDSDDKLPVLRPLIAIMPESLRQEILRLLPKLYQVAQFPYKYNGRRTLEQMMYLLSRPDLEFYRILKNTGNVRNAYEQAMQRTSTYYPAVDKVRPSLALILEYAEEVRKHLVAFPPSATGERREVLIVGSLTNGAAYLGTSDADLVFIGFKDNDEWRGFSVTLTRKLRTTYRGQPIAQIPAENAGPLKLTLGEFFRKHNAFAIVVGPEGLKLRVYAPPTPVLVPSFSGGVSVQLSAPPGEDFPL